jgi:DNA-directed RNA polymerase subunit K/omega
MEMFMAIKTLDLTDLEVQTDNVYEACLVIAKRAREINAGRIAERKEKEILEESGYDQELDIYDREFMEGIEHEREINPTVIAQDQLLEGKIKYRYISENNVNKAEEPSE